MSCSTPLVALPVLLITAVNACAASDVEWAGPVSGLWSDPLAWSTSSIPTANDSVGINLPGVYTVQLDQDATVQGLSVANGPTLEFQPGRTMFLLDDLHNDGLIQINPTGAQLDTTLSFFYDDLSITGTGTLRLNGFGRDAQIVLPGLASFTNGPGHTIAGRGYIDANLVNQGTVLADTGTLSLAQLDQVVNTGTLEAREGALLSCTVNEFDQTGGGSIIADGSGSRVAIGNPAPSGSVITGGALRALSGGSITKSMGSLTDVEILATGQDASIVINDASIIGGIIRADADSSIRVNDCDLVDVDIQSPIRISGLVTLASEIRNDLELIAGPNDAVLIEHDAVVPYPITISMPQGGAVFIDYRGDPTIVSPNLTLRSSVEFLAFEAINRATIILGPGQRVESAIDNLSNRGDILATEDAEVSVTDGVLTNRAMIHIDQQSTLNISNATLIRGLQGNLLAQRNSIVTIDQSQVIGGFSMNLGTDATVTGSDIELQPNEEIFAEHYGTTLALEHSTVTGGLVRMFAGGLITPSYTSIENLSLENGLLYAGRSVEITGTLHNSGEIQLRHGGVDAFRVPDGSEIAGEGTIEFIPGAQLTSASGGEIMIGQGQSLSGFGEIPVPLVNNGTIESSMVLSGDWVQNNATIRANENNNTQITAPVLTQSVDGRIEAIGDRAVISLIDTSIDGGIISTSDGGLVRIEGSCSIDATQSSGSMELIRAGSLTIGPGVAHQGTIRVNPGGGNDPTAIAWDPDQPPMISGTVSLSGYLQRSSITSSTASATPLPIPHTLRVEGIGLIDSDTTIDGEIAPGPQDQLGVMYANGMMSFQPDATLSIRVDDTSADLLVCASQVTLAGTLRVQPLSGDQLPSGYWSRSVVQATGFSGRFDSIDSAGLAPGYTIRVQESAGSISIVQTCIADINLDGQVSFFDVSAFIDAFNAQDPLADLNNDGILNFFDISSFIVSYSQGC